MTPIQGIQSPPDESLTLAALWRIGRKHWPTVLTAVVAVVLAATFYTLGQTKIYQASCTIQLDPNPPRPLGKQVDTVVDMGNGSYWNNREYYETQYKIIQSRRIALAVVKTLDLNHDGGFLRNRPDSERQVVEVSEEDAANVLLTRLVVEPVKESRLVNVTFEDASPARAQRVLSTLADTFIEENLEDTLSSTASASDWLRGQLEKLKGDLESSEMALHDYKLDRNILSVAFDDQSNMLREEMKQINDALTQVRTKRVEVAARRDELLRVKAVSASELPSTELLQSLLLQQLRQRYEESVRDAEGLVASGKGQNHPDVLAAHERVEVARRALLSEVRNVQGALSRDVDALDRQEGGLSQLFEHAKKQAMDLNLLEIEYNRLLRTKDNTQKLYSLVLERTKESDLTRMLRVNNIRTVDRALVPKSPIRPRVSLNVGLSIIGGFVLGLALALGRVALDRSLKTPDDIERELDVTFLGLVPEIEKSTGGTYRERSKRRKRAPAITPDRELIVHQLPMSGIAEAARAIRTNIMFMSPDRAQRKLLVTSAGPAEGKTTVACCIAIAMAQAGLRVALIDCDLRRPRLHRIFGRDNSTGVTTALVDENPIDTSALHTDIPNLSVMGSGPIPPNPAELLHSTRFRRLLDDLATQFDRVVIDSPPVVAVTDAAIISTVVDGTVLVVRAFETSKELGRQAVRALRDVGANLIGTVLNAVNLEKDEYKNYHYYYYRRDGGYASTPNTPSQPSPVPPLQ